MNFAGEAARKILIARGQTLTEYALIMATIVTLLMPFYSMAGSLLTAMIDRVLPLFR